MYIFLIPRLPLPSWLTPVQIAPRNHASALVFMLEDDDAATYKWCEYVALFGVEEICPRVVAVINDASYGRFLGTYRCWEL